LRIVKNAHLLDVHDRFHDISIFHSNRNSIEFVMF